MNNLKLRLNIRMLKCLNIKMAEKGVSIYLALMIMFILLAIGLGISLIIVSQMKMIRGMGDSVVAFYAADTGIEHSLYNLRIQNGDGNVSGSVGDANYQVTSPTAGTYKSKGSFAKAKRAIEINIPLPPVAFDFCLQQPPVGCVNPNPALLCILPGTPGGVPGTEATVTATLLSGDPTNVIFTISALPGNVSADFIPNSCLMSCSSTLRFSVGSAAASDVYPLTIYGTADSVFRTADFILEIAPWCPI